MIPLSNHSERASRHLEREGRSGVLFSCHAERFFFLFCREILNAERSQSAGIHNPGSEGIGGHG